MNARDLEPVKEIGRTGDAMPPRLLRFEYDHRTIKDMEKARSFLFQYFPLPILFLAACRTLKIFSYATT